MDVQSDKYQRLREILDRITYKDGYGYSLDPMERGALVQVTANVRCSRTGVVQMFSGHQAFIEYTLAEEQIVREVFELTLRWERHECAEYFRVDGEVRFDPHAQGAP